ncbi:unnamed protein product [Clonostachys rhizophaga]|uniref:Uncharacterized protein n=1 Tax=Clonostachys rhizophaga TaxID=160324 RepID=A0A9N9VDS2_9HYPO|nr:unnamed protein product [Clonostachys rhizophaga]
MTNDQQPPPPAERAAVLVPSLAPAEHDDSVPFQHSPRSNQAVSEDTASHAHSHWQSHLRRRFAHSRQHLSSFSTSSPDHELETADDSDANNHDADDLSLRSDSPEAQQNHRIDQSPKADADARPADSEPSLVPRVVQTVEIVRVVDSQGQVIETQTIYPSADSGTTDSPAGETAVISAPGSSGTAAPGTVPGASDSAPYPTTTSVRSDATASPNTATASATSSGDTQSLAPTTSGTGLPIMSASIPSLSTISTSLPSQNATNTPISSNSSSTSSPTTPASTPTQSLTILSFSSTPTSSTLTSSESTISSFTESWSSSDSEWSSYPIATGSGVGRGRNGGGGDSPVSTSTAAGDSNAGSNSGGGSGGINLTQQEKQIVGGVVGGVAAAAFFLLFILMAIKWKKRRNDVQELIGEGGIGSRGLPSPRGVGGGGDAPPMAQRSSSFGVAGAFASFTGRKSQPPPPEESGERGFYRVSGRKLPSVLQHGGDGYSDPRRHSTGSGSTGWHRGSQAFEPSTTSPLQLGSPMRPVSGVAIMRSGPARTPVTEQNPFADPPSPTSFPLPPDTHSFDRGPHDERGGPAGFKFQESI